MMRRFLIVIVLGICVGQPIESAATGKPSQKYTRYVQHADQLYDDFVYLKAIEYYKKAIGEDAAYLAYPARQIADSYRRINNNEEAVIWYEKVLNNLTEEDKVHYAQALLEVGRPQEASEVAASIASEKVVANRFESLENRKDFFRDSAAYLVVKSSGMNSDQSDFSPTYYEDGIVFVSNRKSKGLLRSTYYWDESYFLDLYVKAGDEVKSFSKRINTAFHEGPAAFFDGGNQVIFTRNNFNSGRKNTSEEGINKLKLFYAERKAGSINWSKPVELPFNSDEFSVGHPSITEDGKTLYFSSDSPGTQGKADIFKATFENGKWSEPQPLSTKINTADNELFPFIQDGHILYFASEGHPGIGGLDIYKVDLADPDSEVENLGYPINTEKDDFGLIIDGHKGYFSSDREGGLGNDDIYEFDLFLFDIVAHLRDEDTHDLLTGDLQVVDMVTHKVITAVNEKNSIQFAGMRGHSYEVKGTSAHHADRTVMVETLTFDRDERVQDVDVLLSNVMKESRALVVKNYGIEDQIYRLDAQPVAFEGNEADLRKYLSERQMTLTSLLEVQAIYYDFDHYDIRKEAVANLTRLASVLQEYPSLRVVLTSHTDSRGATDYNQRLSQKRAESARDFLLKADIAAHRIAIHAYGEMRQIQPCEEVSCEEDMHQLNRRTEIRLTDE